MQSAQMWIGKREFLLSCLSLWSLDLTTGCNAQPASSETSRKQVPSDQNPRHVGVHAFYQGNYSNFPAATHRALSLPYVSGLSFYPPWKLIEPAPGQYQFSLIDAAINEAKRTDKVVTFGLEVDWWTPDWVRERSAQYTFIHPVLGERRSPVPWDPAYLASLQEAVSALGRRYDGNPNVEFVVISGPATYWGTETNWVLKPGSVPPADQQALGFSLEKYEGTWERMTDLYFRAFPRTELALALNNQVMRSSPFDRFSQSDVDRAVRQIRDYALGEQRRLKPGRKMYLELLGLSRGNDIRYDGPYTGPQSVSDYESLVWEVRPQVNIVYQQASLMRNHGYTPEDVDIDLQIGISFGADVIEIFTTDLFKDNGEVFEPYSAIVRRAHEQLVSVGGRR